jgi:hypothetical protein
MADPVQLLQPGRTQLADVSSLPQPNLNFGQRRPEIEYQAAAEASTGLSRTLSNLATNMFGTAEKFAEAAGEEFVINNPISRKQLEAMSKGNPGQFKRDFSLNAYSAAIQKYRSNEIAAHAEVEIINKTNEIQRKIELGRDAQGNAFEVNTKNITDELTSLTKGWSDSLSQVSTDASYKYRATAATHANRVILAAAKKEDQLNFTKNKVKIVNDVDNNYVNAVTNIIRGGDAFSPKDNAVITVNELIQKEREALISRAFGLGGIDGMNYAMERADKIEAEIKTAILEEAVLSRRDDIGGDLVGLNATIQTRTLPVDLQNVWDSMSVTQQLAARDKMAARYESFIALKTKDRANEKNDQTIAANNLQLDYLNPSTTDAQRAAIVRKLEDISKNFPEIVSAKTIRIDLPTLLKKEVDEDPIKISKLTDKLRDKDPTLRTTEDVINWAKENAVKPSTALDLANRYLPKESGANDYSLRTGDVEYYIRTKKVDPISKRVIKTPADAKAAYEARGLTMQDAPSNLGALLVAQPEGESDVADVIAQIDTYAITTVPQLRAALAGRVVDTNTVNGLTKQIGDRRLQRESLANQGANAIAEGSGTQSPRTKAKIKLDANQAIQDKHAAMIKEWEDGGRKGEAPTMQDATREVQKRALSQAEQKQIDATKQSIVDNYGPNGTVLPKSVKDAKIDLSAVRPSFEPGEPVRVTANYRRVLTDMLKKGGASQAEIDSIVTAMIQQQVFIERTNRNRSVK